MPNLYVIAGCNGSGKTTIAKALLPNYFNCNEFVNADILAAEMSPGNVASVAIAAGKMTLGLVNKLFDEQMSFAIETTLSGRVHQRIIRKAQEKGYYVVLIFVWVDSPGISVKRVKARVKQGGHSVGDEDVIRRFKRGVVNFFNIYMEASDYWVILDNTEPPQKIVAEGMGIVEFNVLKSEIWKGIELTYQKYETGA